MPGSDEQTIVTEEIIDNSEVIPENQMETPESDTETPEEIQEQETKEDEESEEDFSIDDLDLLENETTLATFKANALEVAKQFDIKNILPLYEKLYQEAIEKTHQPL